MDLPSEVFLIIVIIYFLLPMMNSLDLRNRKVVYETDLSEHCKRQVVPSIFLGHKVISTNSRIFKFSQLNLPYSCQISVRSESGNHIILVMQKHKSVEIESTCKQYGQQFRVYTLGETFGGYWGQIPRALITTPNQKELNKRYYTFAQHNDDSYPAEYDSENENLNALIDFEDDSKTSPASITVNTQPPQPQGPQYQVLKEILLVNVSASAVDADVPKDPRIYDDQFDAINVAPVPGVQYSTELVPIAQIQPAAASRKEEDSPNVMLKYDNSYQLDFLDLFTHATRIIKIESPAPAYNLFSDGEVTIEQQQPPLIHEAQDKLVKNTIDEHGLNNHVDSDNENEQQQVPSTVEALNQLINTSIDEQAFTKQVVFENDEGEQQHSPSTENEVKQPVKIDKQSMNNVVNNDEGKQQTPLSKERASEKQVKSKNNEHALNNNVVTNDDDDDEYNQSSFTYDITNQPVNSIIDELTLHNNITTDNDKGVQQPLQTIESTFNQSEKIRIDEETLSNQVASKNDESEQQHTSSIDNADNQSVGIVIDEQASDNDVKFDHDGGEQPQHPSNERAFNKLVKSKTDEQALNNAIREIIQLKFNQAKDNNIYDSDSSDDQKQVLKEVQLTSAMSPSRDKQLIYNHNDMNTPTVNKSLINTGTISSSMDWNSKGTSQCAKEPCDNATTLRLLNHKSWDNVVQAAPQIAGILSHTSPDYNINISKHKLTLEGINSKITSEKAISTRKSSPSSDVTTSTASMAFRRKRWIEAVPISNAKPLQKLPALQQPNTMTKQLKQTDMIEMSDYLELVDDEVVGGRLAFRDVMNKYTGQMLFDICNPSNNLDRNRFIVLLANTSRILLHLNNFSMTSLTVVVTAAHTLTSPSENCRSGTLECQVTGTRVCVDESCACDALPNCGSLTMYDEDKTTCIVSNLSRSRVYLIALVFLLALLVAIYMVYHWLQRCVPKVSDAFFIYTENTENVLYLDTIMRSPHEPDAVMPENFIHSRFFEDDIELRHQILPRKRFKLLKKTIRRMLQILTFGRFGQRKSQEVEIASFNESMRMYSFAEMEMINMMARKNQMDASVQTGESLEIGMITKSLKKKGKTFEESKPSPSKPYGEEALRNRLNTPEAKALFPKIIVKDKSFEQIQRDSKEVPRHVSSISQVTTTSIESDPLKELNAIRLLKKYSANSLNSVNAETSFEFVPRQPNKHFTSLDEEELCVTSLSGHPFRFSERMIKTLDSIAEPVAGSSRSYEANWIEKGRSSPTDEDQVKKRLRFEEGTISIHDNLSTQGTSSASSWKEAFLGIGKRKKDLSAIEEENTIDSKIHTKEKDKRLLKESKKKKTQKLSLK